MRLPERASVTGSIAAIKQLDNAEYEVLRRDTFALTIQEFNGHLATVWVSKNQVSEYELDAILFIGNIVSVELAKNVADETYYLDADGEKIPHEETFDSFVGMIGTTPVLMNMLGVPQFIIEDVVKQRGEREASKPKKEGKFHALRGVIADDAKEDHINSLLEKRAGTKNVVIISTIDAKLKSLGYVEPKAPTKEVKETVK
jgi:hypothetical protein